LRNNTASNNAGFGSGALYTNTTGTGNTALGPAAYGSTQGPLGLNTSGSSNTAIGMQALLSNTTASNNTAVGHSALYTNTTGANNTAIGRNALQSSSTGAQNTAIGLDAGDYVTTGNYNTLLGYNSGSSTTNLTTGDANTLIGAFCHTGAAGSGFANGFGYDIDAAAGYTTLGNAASDIRAAHGVATWATVSDERYKKDIVDSTVGLSFINALLPRTFKYKTLGELPETFRAYKEGSTDRSLKTLTLTTDL
jgi:trimeric autotransporter adhesin